MAECKILIWSLHKIMLNIFKPLERNEVVVKSISEFGMSIDYNSQEDFDNIIKLYPADIVILYNVSRRGLTFIIPYDIIVVTYCDHYIEQFSLIGKNYFKSLTKKDFLYIPALNVERKDKDNVLKDNRINRQIITVPFVSENMDCFETNMKSEEDLIDSRFTSEVSVVASYADTGYYNWCFDLSKNTPYGRALMQFIGIIVLDIRKEIFKREMCVLDIEWINKLIIKIFDKFNIWEYSNNHDKFLEIWSNAVVENIVFHEYVYCIVKWLAESSIDFKVWGSGWERVPVVYNKAMGTVGEGSKDLDKIYRNSKISINPNIYMGIHRRVFEIIRNKCLWMQADSNVQNMSSDFRPYFNEGKSVVTFKNKEELFSNINYYLSHNNERERIISEASKVVKEMNWDMKSVVNNAFEIIIKRVCNIK